MVTNSEKWALRQHYAGDGLFTLAMIGQLAYEGFSLMQAPEPTAQTFVLPSLLQYTVLGLAGSGIFLKAYSALTLNSYGWKASVIPFIHPTPPGVRQREALTKIRQRSV